VGWFSRASKSTALAPREAYGFSKRDDETARAFCRAVEEKSLGSMAFPAFGGGPYGYGGIAGNGAFGSSWLANYLPGAQRDYAAEAGNLWQNSAIAACLNWITSNFDEPHLQVARQDEEDASKYKPVVRQRFTELMDQPNPDYDGDALWAATVLSFIVSGNAYWIKAKSPSRQKMYLYWAPYWEMQPRWSSDGKQFLDHYDHVVDGKRFIIPKENVVHFRNGLNPINPRAGLPQLEPVLREVVSDNGAATYTAAICRNWGVPRVLMMPETEGFTIDPEQQANLKELWREGTTGENAGSALTSSTKIKVVELTLTPDKMTLDKIRQIPEARICAALGLDPMVVGLSVGGEHRTYSNLQVAERMAYRNCLIPLQKRFARKISRDLLPELGGQPGDQARWDYSTVEALQEEAMSVAKRVTVLVNAGIMTVNEARAKLGIKEWPGEGANVLASDKQRAEQAALFEDQDLQDLQDERVYGSGKEEEEETEEEPKEGEENAPEETEKTGAQEKQAA
jgi:HK97 family phage portal protein